MVPSKLKKLQNFIFQTLTLSVYVMLLAISKKIGLNEEQDDVRSSNDSEMPFSWISKNLKKKNTNLKVTQNVFIELFSKLFRFIISAELYAVQNYEYHNYRK